MSRKKSTRQLIGIDDITNDSVVTGGGELAFYFVHPSNLNVLPEQGVRAKVQELKTASQKPYQVYLDADATDEEIQTAIRTLTEKAQELWRSSPRQS